MVIADQGRDAEGMDVTNQDGSGRDCVGLIHHLAGRRQESDGRWRSKPGYASRAHQIAAIHSAKERPTPPAWLDRAVEAGFGHRRG